MLFRTVISASFLFGALALSSATARADVPPPDSCSTAGQACNTAPPDYKHPGMCTASKCQKALPDGSVEYDCTLCVPSDSGSAGAGGGAGAGGATATGGSTATGGKKAAESSDDGGCTLGAPSAERSSVLIALGLALGGLAALRRRG